MEEKKAKALIHMLMVKITQENIKMVFFTGKEHSNAGYEGGDLRQKPMPCS